MPTKKTIKKSVTKTTTATKNKVSFIDAVRSYWAGYFKFDGVSSRAQYWWAVLFVILVNILFNFVGIRELSLVVTLILFLPSRAVAFRRFHDVGLSGWWNLAPVLIGMCWFGMRSNTWAFMLDLEHMPGDMKVFGLLAIIWAVFNFIVVVQPSKLQNNKYRK